jgi:hypothetical protein
VKTLKKLYQLVYSNVIKGLIFLLKGYVSVPYAGRENSAVERKQWQANTEHF